MNSLEQALLSVSHIKPALKASLEPPVQAALRLKMNIESSHHFLHFSQSNIL